MNNRKNYIKNTTTLILVAFLVIAASISFVAYAEDHQDTVTYDIDEMDDFEMEYPNIVEVTGDSIEHEDEFVLYNDGERTEYTFTADEDGVVTIDTDELDNDPTGSYILADEPFGDVTAQDTTEDGDSVVVEEASSNVDYVVSVHETDEEGDAIVSEDVGSEQFDAGTVIQDYEISTSETLDENEDYVVAISEQGEDDLFDTSEITLTFDSDYGADNDSDGELDDRLMAPFTVTGDGTFGDERYEQDFDLSDSLTTVYVGQELVLGSDELDSDNSYELYYHDGDDKNLIQDLTVRDSDTFNTHELRIDTTLPNSELGPEGSFSIEKNNDEIIQWNAVEQDLNAEVNKSSVNLHTSDTDVDLNVTSSNRGSNYDILIDSEQVDAEELIQLIDESEFSSIVNVYEEDAEDEDNEQVRITNVDTSETDEFTVPLDFDGANEDSYEFNVNVADTDAEHNTDAVEVAFFDESSAVFNQDTYSQNQGDTVEFVVDMDETTDATLEFTDSEYELELDLEADTHGGDVVIHMNTYSAGDGGTIGDVFTVEDGGEIVNTDDELPSVSGPFDTGVYDMELHVADRNTDLSTLYIQDRESHNIETWVMPQNTDATLSNLEDVGTRQDKVAMKDMFVVEIEASGLYNQELLHDDTDVESFVEKDEFVLEIIERDTDRHQNNTTVNVNDADNIEVAPDDDKFYLFFDTTAEEEHVNDIYETESGEYNVNPMVEYDINFDFTNEYHYVHDEGETDANLHENVEFVERDIVTNLPSVTVDEGTLDSRHGLAAVENSTVSGDTYIAPHTDNIDIVVRTEGSEESDPESTFFSERVSVTEDGTVSADFDLSNIEVDRLMQIQYRPIDEDYRGAVMMESDEPPEITEFSSDDTPVTVGNEVGFNLDVNSTSDSLNYDWDFDDGETSQRSSPSHVYDEAGTYDVEVTVTDNADQSDTATTEIVVEEAPNEPPTIEQIVAPEDAEVGEEITVTAIAFDENQSELEYTWDFDDGSTGSGVSTTHTYDTEGTYDIELTVVDSEGDSTTDSVTIQVTDSDSEDESDEGPYEFTMTAIDSESDENIPGVSVDILQDDEIVDDVSTDENGIAMVELEDGEYDIEASVDGYEDLSAGTLIDGEDNEIDLIMTVDDTDEDDPSQPGFTAMIAAFALIAGSLIAYRRKD